MLPNQDPNRQEPTGLIPGANVPDRLRDMLAQLQRNRKYGGFKNAPTTTPTTTESK